jgi:hypothetical protein
MALKERRATSPLLRNGEEKVGSIIKDRGQARQAGFKPVN